MADAYAVADLLLTRAGASTLGELRALGKPAILVPYPFAAEGHQAANAAPLRGRRGRGRARRPRPRRRAAYRRCSRQTAEPRRAGGAQRKRAERCREAIRSSRFSPGSTACVARKARAVTGFHFIGVGGHRHERDRAHSARPRARPSPARTSAVTPLVEQLRREGVRIIDRSRRAKRRATRTPSSSAPRSTGATPSTWRRRERGIPVLHRGEMLARLLAGAPRHRRLRNARQDDDDRDDARGAARAAASTRGSCSAASTARSKRNAHDGDSPWFVTEADESDGSFALLEPAIAIVTNIENDHLTSDDELPGLVRAFGEFLGKLPDDGLAVDRHRQSARGLADLARPARARRDVRPRFSRGRARRRTSHSKISARASTSSPDDVRLGSVELRVPGAMNVQNALAAVAVGHELGVRFAAIAAALRGVSRRAPALRGLGSRANGMTLVDDYAHHPTAVRATIAAARQLPSR